MVGRPHAVTVASVWVEGEYPYTAEYVVRLRSMVSRWLGRPFRFVCLTDRPYVFEHGGAIEPIPVTKLPGFAPWTKLELFNPAREFDGRVLYLDLDSLIVGPLEPIVDAPAAFAITADPASAQKRTRTIDAFGRKIVRRFNSSVMVWDAGAVDDLYTDFRASVARRLSGDQDWIGERKPDAFALPREWFPRISELVEVEGTISPGTADKVILAKRPKNAEAAALYPWVRKIWR